MALEFPLNSGVLEPTASLLAGDLAFDAGDGLLLLDGVESWVLLLDRMDSGFA